MYMYICMHVTRRISEGSTSHGVAGFLEVGDSEGPESSRSTFNLYILHTIYYILYTTYYILHIMYYILHPTT